MHNSQAQLPSGGDSNGGLRQYMWYLKKIKIGIFFIIDYILKSGHGVAHPLMGQKKCSKVGISFGGLYMVIWGSTTKKLNRASAQMDFTEFSWLVSFWSGGGLFPIEYVCLNIKKNMICPLKMAENSVF